MFKAINGSKMAEKTSWENGVDPDTVQVFDYDLEFNAETIEDLILEITDYLGVDPSHVDVDTENNLINISRLEDGRSIQASEDDKIDWRDGYIDLWNCSYQFEIVEQKQANLEGKQ